MVIYVCMLRQICLRKVHSFQMVSDIWICVIK